MITGSLRATAGALFTLSLLLPARALGYSDLGTFEAPTAEGGGGGRWFTGSPADGYGCAVCHGRGKAFAVGVSMPEIYDPGVTYEFLITWTTAAPHLSAVVELTDAMGNGVGTVAVPGGADMTDLDACEPYEAHIPAVQLYDGDRGRKLVGLADCGGRQFRFQWTAPVVDVGPVFFSGGVVQSDDNSDLLGDTVARMHRPIRSRSSLGYEEQTTGGCTVTGAAPARSGLLLPLWCALALGLRRRSQLQVRANARARTR